MKSGMQIAKEEERALEKVFKAEIEGRLPFQSKARVFKTLAGYGWLEWGEVQMGMITVKGWYLTHEGRCLYCSTCV